MYDSNSMTDQSFPAEIDHLEKMVAFVKSIAAQLPFDHKTLTRIELVAEEALVNIVNYGYPNNKNGRIDISCRLDHKEKITITIKDTGIPFDPIKNAINIDTEAPLEDRTYGGYGVYFILKIMDKVEYQRVDNTNILVMEKRVVNQTT